MRQYSTSRTIFRLTHVRTAGLLGAVVWAAACGGEIAPGATSDADAADAGGRDASSTTDDAMEDATGLDGGNDAEVDADGAVGCAEGSTPCGVGCVDVQTDGKNCGSCAHDCLGGSCLGGMCQPVTIAAGQDDPSGIAVDATSVYWTDKTGVKTCDKNGCAGQPVLLASIVPPGTYPWGIPLGLDGGNLYWGDTTGLRRCAVGGCAQMPVLVWSMGGGEPGFGGGNIYFEDGQGIVTCPTSGCGQKPTTVTSETNASGGISVGLAVDSTAVYWTWCGNAPAGGVEACSLQGCNNNPTVLAVGCAYDIVAYGGSVYWASDALGGEGIESCSANGCAMKPTLVAAVAPGYSAVGLAVDDGTVYWTDAARVMSCSLGGCGANSTILATRSGGPRKIALDAKSIYWTEYGGAIMRLAR